MRGRSARSGTRSRCPGPTARTRPEQTPGTAHPQRRLRSGGWRRCDRRHESASSSRLSSTATAASPGICVCRRRQTLLCGRDVDGLARQIDCPDERCVELVLAQRAHRHGERLESRALLCRDRAARSAEIQLTVEPVGDDIWHRAEDTGRFQYTDDAVTRFASSQSACLRPSPPVLVSSSHPSAGAHCASRQRAP